MLIYSYVALNKKYIKICEMTCVKLESILNNMCVKFSISTLVCVGV